MGKLQLTLEERLNLGTELVIHFIFGGYLVFTPFASLVAEVVIRKDHFIFK